MRYLFIGGCKDGKRIEIPTHRNAVEMPVPDERSVTEPFEQQRLRTYETHVYTKQTYRAGQSYIDYFQWDKLTPEKALEMMFEGYQAANTLKPRTEEALRDLVRNMWSPIQLPNQHDERIKALANAAGVEYHLEYEVYT